MRQCEKKSYTGFVIGLLGYAAALFVVAFLPAEDFSQPMRLLMLLTAWYMAWLTFHIWRRDRIYWYNGVSFEEAEAAGSERRKTFAWRHFRIFGMLALIVTAISLATWLLGWSAWIDFAVCTVGLIAACICTVPVKL